MNTEQLVEKAKEMLKEAYVPYSKFPVGAALLTKGGKLYQGCNIENAAYPVTCCAERVAIFNAISKGEREFSSMAVIANTERPASPCGSCRQVMSEFFPPDLIVYISSKSGEIKEMTVQELLPFSFNTEDLHSGQNH